MMTCLVRGSTAGGGRGPRGRSAHGSRGHRDEGAQRQVRDASGGPGMLEGMGTDESLERQIRFVLEADRLKTVARQSRITDGSRHENSAEHSWHLALMAMT